MKFTGIILLFLFLSYSYADVYWLRDVFRKSSRTRNNYSEDAAYWQISQLVDFEVLYSEAVRINGSDGVLEVGLLGYTYFDFLYELENYILDNVTITPDNAIINFGNVRYLVYNAGNINPAICFAFRVPAAKYPPALPFGIPEPGGGAVYEKIVEFPDRKAVYVTFNNVDSAEDAFMNCAAWLKSAGYVRVGGSSETTAGFFMTADGGMIVTMSFSDEGKTGFIYKRERKK